MVTTLTGANSFDLKSQLEDIKDTFKKHSDDLAIEKVSVDEIDFEDFKQSLFGNSLFAEKRLVILDKPSVSKQFVESAEELISNLPETTDLVIIEPAIDKRSSYFKLLKKTNFIECAPLGVDKLTEWIKLTFKDRGGEISHSDAQYLIERVGDDQLMLSNEIDKLVLYSSKVTKEIIDLLTVESTSTTVFNLLDAVFANNIKSALSIYDKQRKLKVEPVEILAMFVWQLQLISLCLSAEKVSVGQLASQTNISPYPLTKAKQIASRLTLPVMKTLVSNLLQIDYLSKTISYNLDQALQNFIVETATSF